MSAISKDDFEALFAMNALEREMTEKHLWPTLRALGVSNPEDFEIVFEIRALSFREDER